MSKTQQKIFNGVNKKTIIIIIVVAIIIGGGAFYGGMKYSKSKNSQKNFSQTDFQNLSPKERQQRMQKLGTNAGNFRNGTSRQQGGGFTNGEILSKDDKSITIKLKDGGSKIIFFADPTEITKSVSGTLVDLEVGKSIMINGKANQDGSITADSIQLRP